MILGKVMDPALKQSNDSIGGMGRRSSWTHRTAVSSGLSGWFRSFLTFYDGQLNFLPILKSDFRERFEDPILVYSLNGFCHGNLGKVTQFFKLKSTHRVDACQIHDSLAAEDQEALL